MPHHSHIHATGAVPSAAATPEAAASPAITLGSVPHRSLIRASGTVSSDAATPGTCSVVMLPRVLHHNVLMFVPWGPCPAQLAHVHQGP